MRNAAAGIPAILPAKLLLSLERRASVRHIPAFKGREMVDGDGGGGVDGEGAAGCRRSLHGGNAVSAHSAVTYEPCRRMQRRMFERMQRSGVVAAGEGRWFLDIPRYHETVSARRRRALGALGLGLLGAVGLALLG